SARAPGGALEGALGRGGGEVVDGGERRAEVVAKAGTPRRQPHEDEAAVGRHAFDRGEPASGLGRGEPRAVVALSERNIEDRPVQPVGPGVVRAAQRLAAVAGRLAYELGSLVGTAVDQYPHRAVSVTQHDARLRG